MQSSDAIARGLEGYLELLSGDARVQGEFQGSRAEFFPSPAAASTRGAEQRHLEWFLLERPSPALGAVPALAWRDAWLARHEGASPGLSASLLQSLPGAFEVTSSEGGEGLWVRDLFTNGELPVSEAPALSAAAVGDLLVGRLYPLEGGGYAASQAAVWFRSARLLAAMRTDLAAMRSARRGVLRIQQLELERLFLAPELDVRPRPEQARAVAREALLALGLGARAVESLLRRVARAADDGEARALTEILNGLAFETRVDLASARSILLELWHAERGARPTTTQPSPETSSEAEIALEAFDRGRREGKDLEQLFRELERDLGLDETPEAEEEELAETTVLPGVVGALVEEFLWDSAREHGPERAASLEGLRVLGDYGQDIGVLEDLDRLRLLDFSARWLLDQHAALSPAEAAGVLEALMAFCAWSEERHQHPLLQQFGATLRSLQVSVPRLLRLPRRGPALAEGELCVIASVERGFVRLQEDDREIPVTPEQAASLIAGDVVGLAKGSAEIGNPYPGELTELLAPKGSRRSRGRTAAE